VSAFQGSDAWTVLLNSYTIGACDLRKCRSPDLRLSKRTFLPIDVDEYQGVLNSDLPDTIWRWKPGQYKEMAV